MFGTSQKRTRLFEELLIVVEEQINKMKNDTVSNDTALETPSEPDLRKVKEDTVNFLESLGLQEGIDFVVFEEEIYPSVDVDLPESEIALTFTGMTFPHWPELSFSCYGNEESVVVVDSEKSVTFSIPFGAYLLIYCFSRRKR